MKKYCALLLALLLLAATAPLALATQMYDTYGDMEYWDDTTWILSESWTDKEWEEYWLGEEEAYQQIRQQELRAERQKLGLPNLDGVNVKLDDKFLTFANAQPYVEYGTIYLPLRDFLAACGIEAQISYDATTGTAHIVLADGSELTTTLGEYGCYAEDADGKEIPIYSYDPPLMINGIFYIDAWALCQFLGLDPHWDYDYEILYLVDYEALITQINSNFTSYNRLFQMPTTVADMQQAYKFSGHIALSGTVYGDTKDDTAKALLEYNGIAQGNNADISLASHLDTDQIKNTLLSWLDDEAWLMLKAIASGRGRVIINGDEGNIYAQSNLLPLLDARLSSKDWVQWEYALTPEDMTAVGNIMFQQYEGESIGSFIYDSAYYNSYYSYYGDNSDIYATALRQAQQLQALLGDENFKQENRGGYTVYSLKTNQNKLRQAMEESDLYLPGSDIFSSLFGYSAYGLTEEGVSAVSHELTFREKDGQIADLQMSASLQTSGVVPVTYKLNLEYDSNHIKASFEMNGRYGGKLIFDMNYEQTPVKETPAAAPPEGSRIVPNHELNSQRMYWF